MKYNKEHICVRKSGSRYFVGISEQYLSEIDEIEYVTLPTEGDVYEGDELCCVETQSTSYDFCLPFYGKIVVVNDELEHNPALLANEEDGWICIMEDIDDDIYDELLNHDKYFSYLDNEGLL